MMALNRTPSLHLEGGIRPVQQQHFSGFGCLTIRSDDDVTPSKAGLSSDPDQRKLFPVLDMLCRLFVLDTLSRWLDWFLAMGYMQKAGRVSFICSIDHISSRLASV